MPETEELVQHRHLGLLVEVVTHSVVDAVRGRAKITKICPDGSFSVLRAIVVELLLGRS